MKGAIFTILLATNLINTFPQKGIPLELYVRCCMGDVKPNVEEYGIGISVYKDSVYIGVSYWDYRLTLPDTGTYVLKTLEGPQTHAIYVDSYEHIIRDTFEIRDWREYFGTKKGEKTCWECGWCVMDGHVVFNHKKENIVQEGMFTKGRLKWYKFYQDGELIYYYKINYRGKKVVFVDKRWDYYDFNKNKESKSNP